LGMLSVWTSTTGGSTCPKRGTGRRRTRARFVREAHEGLSPLAVNIDVGVGWA
jgi:hypothetical protein